MASYRLFLVFLASQLQLCLLIDITNDVFGKLPKFVPAAFGDFNADKHTDIVAISNDADSVEVLLLTDVSLEKGNTDNLACHFPHKKIVSVMPGDFDGDGAMDLAIIDFNGKYNIYVAWGNLSSLDCKSGGDDPVIVMQGQPLVLDSNGDMIADLFGADEHGNWAIWEFPSNSSLRPQKIIVSNGNDSQGLRMPSSHAFIDLNNDLFADLWVSGTKSFELWTSTLNGLRLAKTINYPQQPHINNLQTSFADMNLDGSVDIILPHCADRSCSGSEIYVYDFLFDKWMNMKVNFTDGSGNVWKFCLDEKEIFKNTISLRTGDFNLDGYPDVLVTLVSPSESAQSSHVVLLQNVPCTGSCEFSRTLQPQWGMFDYWNSTVMGTFFDFQEDGTLDVILVSKDTHNLYTVAAFRNAMEYDAMFFKVLVSTGRCYNYCPNKKFPYGTNQPGPTMCYTITTASGDLQTSCITQLSQSAHFALMLPYTVFGLSRNWNFVEKLHVGLPRANQSSGYVSTFTQIIPNSQVIVIPYPPNHPDSWIFKLFITPGKAMTLTAGALIATCLFIAAIIGVLHYREVLQDRKEKLKEAQHFHFDAM